MIEEVKNCNKIVERDGYFLPLVFTDLPAMICTGAVVTASKEISKKIDEGKHKIEKIALYKESFYVSVPLCLERLPILRKSIKDIVCD